MSAQLKPKHQRLILVVIAVVVLVCAGLLASWALRNQASYFYLPEQMLADPPAPDLAVRLGGMVQEGSLKTARDGVTISFKVTGKNEAFIPVTYRGIVPDLFVEGSGVVAEGRLGSDGTFVADNLLAKHDENYVPRELEGMGEQEASDMARKTTIGLE